MCMNRKPAPKYDVLSKYAVAILTGQPVDELATQNGMTRVEMIEKIKEIDEVNPPLYHQLMDKIGETDQ